MCGLAGLIATPGTYGGTELAQAVHRMTSVLWHRGPDSCGTWIDPQTGVALGHRRLAIIDLSEEGHQPMVSETGRFVIIFNGEIYNFRSIRRELTELGWHFRGHSDTEVLLAAIEQWGLEVTLPKLAGMFAFAVWNRESRILHLVRDRIGKKPLYLGWANREFVFASELKAFREHSSFVPAVNRDALVSLLRFGYVPAPHTIYQDVFKLLPGSCLSLPLATIGSARDDVLERMRRYWSAAEVAERGVAAPLALSAAEAVDQLDRLLSQATAERMIADVPLGALLSGGVDSSTVVALMQKQSTRPIKTFSVGFHEAGYDEAIDAERVAGHLGTDHTQLYVTPTEAQAVIPRLPEIYDEPFADQSQIPTFLVSQLARRQVTVALSGDGGDEVFGGYNRYFLAPWLWRRMRACPWAIRRGVANVFTMLSSDSRGVLARRMDRLLPRGTRLPAPGYHLNKFASILAVQGPDDLYLNVISRWHQPTAAILAGSDPAVAAGAGISLDDLTDRAMYYDTVGYLPDDILVKVDRASMAVSLEVRAPLLDHRVVEFAWRLPRAMKLRGRQGKWVLRQLLYRYVPRDLVDRPKQGFDVPVDDWLRAPLRDWAEEMLASARLAAEGFFDPRPIRDLWSEHLAGKRNGGDCLWPILMFQAWQERWLGPRASKPASGAALHATAASC